MDPTVKKAARAILLVFREKGIAAGGFLDFDEFGKALRWEAGHVKHENQRLGLRFLVEEGYVIERSAGLELTARGDKVLRSR